MFECWGFRLQFIGRKNIDMNQQFLPSPTLWNTQKAYFMSFWVWGAKVYGLTFESFDLTWFFVSEQKTLVFLVRLQQAYVLDHVGKNTLGPAQWIPKTPVACQRPTFLEESTRSGRVIRRVRGQTLVYIWVVPLPSKSGKWRFYRNPLLKMY